MVGLSFGVRQLVPLVQVLCLVFASSPPPPHLVAAEATAYSSTLPFQVVCSIFEG